MAHGLPDWYRGVDIAYQALAQMITRPTYGAAVRTSGFKSCAGSGYTELFNISGKGMTYGGYVRLTHASTQKDSAVWLYTDTGLVCNMSFYDGDRFNIIYLRGHPLIISKYDDTSFVYCILVSYGITFESGLQILFNNYYAGAVTVYYEIIYGLV
jgi:hypothetical protein